MLNAKEVMQISPIIPVLALKDAGKAVELAKALQAGGINIMEVTLRTDQALDAIEKIATALPSMIIGAGTVLNPHNYDAVKQRGAKFVISPGMTPALLEHAGKDNIPFIPGVASASEIMTGLEYGLDAFKLFPANIVGGAKALKAFGGPFEGISFCPTGGVNKENMNEYLELKNVLCVGGTWIAPSDLIDASDFESITLLCKDALNAIRGKG